MNEFTIHRKYLQELFEAEVLEISEHDGFPTFNPIIIEYFKLRGILIEFYGNVLKLIINKNMMKSER